MLTGLRPGELTHLLLPDDLDLESGVLRVSNKPRLHWQVKTRNEREIPLLPALVNVLRAVVGGRTAGLVFLRRRFSLGELPLTHRASHEQLVEELRERTETNCSRGTIRIAASTRSSRTPRAAIWRSTIRSRCVANVDMAGLLHLSVFGSRCP
jgi:integrase